MTPTSDRCTCGVAIKQDGAAVMGGGAGKA